MSRDGTRAEAPEVSAAAGRGAWPLRPVILFAAAYTLLVVPHELAHALTARALGVPSTLFHFAVNIARDRGSPFERGLIASAGPLASLTLGLIFWLFGTAGAASGGKRPSGERQTLRAGWDDFALLAAAALAVRVLAGSIAFGT